MTDSYESAIVAGQKLANEHPQFASMAFDVMNQLWATEVMFAGRLGEAMPLPPGVPRTQALAPPADARQPGDDQP